jgi:hypothetical protein
MINQEIFEYSARRLIGSRIIESAVYCNQKLLAHLYLNSTQNISVNWIIRLLLSLLCWPKVILLSGGHCISIYTMAGFLNHRDLNDVFTPIKYF